MKSTSIKVHPISHDDKKPLQKEVGQLALDIYHTDKELVIVAPIAGVGKDQVQLSITDDVLVIRGERKLNDAPKEEQYYTKECFWGAFSRSIVLPLEADASKVKASFEQNILEIRIPMSEKERTKIIKIKAA